ncbi:hypothetical protein ABZ904_23850 [Streptomyces sp. NPDC046900]|uniref:hypothetical protein n=1 Tax=Streptomyces sp. NPDC046900 TaxID=3155473 RepID=UPI0033D98A34
MGSKRNHGKRYTEQFEWDAVTLERSSGKTVTEVARDPGKDREHAAAREHGESAVDAATVEVWAHGPGTVEVSVKSGGHTGSITLTVTKPASVG